MKSTILAISILFALLANGCSNSTQPSSGGSLQFATTSGMYAETDNLDSAVKAELGTSYRIADWTDVEDFCYHNPVDSLIAKISWGLMGGAGSDTTRENFFVTWDSQGFTPQDPTRHYFATRFDHNVPGNWLVLDQIDSNHIVLGSWYGVQFRVLAVKP